MSKRMSFVDLAHRGAVTGLVGLGIWGLWLTAAVWKSRRDERLIISANGGQIPISQQAIVLAQQNGQDPYPITNDPKHEPGRRV
ncbi:hypothetical protein PSEUBRA_002155 [Kalmanozyma brasiliensis GHG001]|uniref:Spliceosomal protein snRNP-U1A/U2B n=1 Tax=Kalmanozyma brasiliensis (strain GHG001) TaxID=1365824 RepID=V5GR26_KALBG|nr:uncharacterized protein PSEUBRA_002155 [Kalmanozyma brasiliensis GHG001]EST08397.1 hypothetical protein PSEUBRA_002155 [Kalmanozyma brasiliensis GHG001]